MSSDTIKNPLADRVQVWRLSIFECQRIKSERRHRRVYFKIQRIKVRDFGVIRHDIHTAARGFRDGGEVPNVLGLRYQRNKVATGRVIRIDQLSLSRRGGRAGGAFKIKDFAFFVFIAGLKVNFFLYRVLLGEKASV